MRRTGRENGLELGAGPKPHVSCLSRSVFACTGDVTEEEPKSKRCPRASQARSEVSLAVEAVVLSQLEVHAALIGWKEDASSSNTSRGCRGIGTA